MKSKMDRASDKRLRCKLAACGAIILIGMVALLVVNYT